MEPQRPTEQAKIGIDREALEAALLSMKLSLTTAWARAQLLERRSLRGEPMTIEQIERAASTISSSCANMARTIHEIEAALNQRGDATDATDR